MDLEQGSSPATRRRGQELEDALLDAAWDQLVASGYGAFTLEAVAERAGTSRPVIYRRWKNRSDLALAAISHNARRRAEPIPNTGTLRGDIIALLQRANETRFEFAAVIGVQLSSYYQETGTSPADLRLSMIGNRVTSIEAILQRAVERGEVDAGRLTPRLVSLPFDLFRHEVLMTLKPVPQSTIVAIVDEIFLPLVT